MSSRLDDRRLALAELRAGLDGETVLRDLLGVHDWEERNDELVMHCILPFGMHSGGDRNPSAAFNREKLVYNCFVCGGGDVLWLLESVLQIDRAQAVGMLEGVLNPEDITSEDLLAVIEEIWRDPDFSITLPSYPDAMLRPFQCYATYLDERGVSREVQRELRTGIDLHAREQVQETWIEQPRLVIPAWFRSKLRGWQKRRIDDRLQFGPKYLNTPGFPRERILYGIDDIDSECVTVVESPLSRMRMMTEGIRSVVATFGAEVTPDQAALLRGAEKVIVWMDADEAGRKGATILARELEGHTRVWIVPAWKWWSQGTDPADMDGGGMRAALKEAEPSLLVVGEDDDEEARRHRQSPARHLARQGGRR